MVRRVRVNGTTEKHGEWENECKVDERARILAADIYDVFTLIFEICQKLL